MPGRTTQFRPAEQALSDANGTPSAAAGAASAAAPDLPPLDKALDALTDAACALLGADSTVAVVWDERRDLGTIRAGSGHGAAHVGTTVGPDAGPHEGRVPGGEPFRAGTREIAAAARGVAAVVTVPIDGFLPTRLLLSASWREPQPPDVLARAEEGLRALTRLTQLASEAELELARLDEQARLDAVLECVGDGVWLETSDGPTLNRAARELLGLDEGDSARILDPVLRRLDGTPIADAERPRARALATRTTVPFLHQRARKDGAPRVFQGTASPVYGPAGPEPIGTVVTFRDATEEYNRNLLTERFLEQLFEALPLGVGVADPATGELLSVNQAYAELVGYERDEMVGTVPPRPWCADVPPLDPTDPPRPREALFRRADGRLVPVELVPLVVREVSGKPAATVTLVTDLSERRRFERQMLQSGRLAAIGELAAGVAHEINNPLFAILGLVEFLLKEVEPGTKAHERLRLVQQTGLEIKDVVRALLDFARERSDEFEPVALADVLAQTVELVRRTSLRKEIELVERYAPEPIVAVASGGQLKQVVLNLVTNAQQAMADSGTITVELGRDGDQAVVRVSDTGPGIAPEVFDRIFDPFFTTKRELGGTGLGLPLSQGIVDAHGGTLAAGSRPGGGAAFTITLPLAEAAS